MRYAIDFYLVVHTFLRVIKLSLNSLFVHKTFLLLPGLLDLLNEMNTKLEEIQKSLDMYLETKRQFFPRFYFLSNDDLLEILGQSKNPEAVQPHMKKCFDNIKILDIAKMRDHHEATHMNSAEGEKVELKAIVRLEGPVEVRLTVTTCIFCVYVYSCG